ncbi:MAG: IclR family transcriptional regulator [Collinsella sp.]
MRKVVASCGETCQLGVLDHGRVLYISRVDSPQHIRLSSEIGKTLPAHCTAIGKAILSRWDEELVRSLLPVPFEKTTEHAVKHIDDLMRQLEEVRRCGFAYDHQRWQGVECIAVPTGGGRLYGLRFGLASF